MLLPDITQSPSLPHVVAGRQEHAVKGDGQRGRRELMKLVCPHVTRVPKQLFTGAEAGSRPACLPSPPSEAAAEPTCPGATGRSHVESGKRTSVRLASSGTARSDPAVAGSSTGRGSGTSWPHL